MTAFVPQRASAGEKMLGKSKLKFKEVCGVSCCQSHLRSWTTGAARCLRNYGKGERCWPRPITQTPDQPAWPQDVRDMSVWGDFKELLFSVSTFTCAQAGTLSTCVTHLRWETGRLRRVLETAQCSISPGVLCDLTVKSLRSEPESWLSKPPRGFWSTLQGWKPLN